MSPSYLSITMPPRASILAQISSLLIDELLELGLVISSKINQINSELGEMICDAVQRRFKGYLQPEKSYQVISGR